MYNNNYMYWPMLISVANSEDDGPDKFCFRPNPGSSTCNCLFICIDINTILFKVNSEDPDEMA